MSAYKQTFEEAIKLLGFKKALAEFLTAGRVIDEKTVGQFTFISNINTGGVTDAFINKKIQ
jgi:hypothetical protein